LSNWIFILFAIVGSLILQTTLIPEIFTSIGYTLHWNLLEQQTINIAFIILMYLCFCRPFFSAIFWWFFLVLLQNSFDVAWKSSLAFSYLFILIIIYVLETMFVFQYSLNAMLAVFGFILLQNILHLLLGSAAVGFDVSFASEMPNLILHTIINTIAAPFIFYVLYVIDKNTTFHFDKSKSFFGRRVGL
jgi:hypothetical protein